MIRRLRVKFICINMAIVTVMMLAILGMLLHFTRNDLEQQSIRVMQSVMEDRAYPSRPGEFPRQAKLPYFYVSVNTLGELSASFGGYYDLTNTEAIQEIITLALNSDDQTGILKDYSLRFQKRTTPFGQTIVFVDMSSELATMRSLTNTSGAVLPAGKVGGEAGGDGVEPAAPVRGGRLPRVENTPDGDPDQRGAFAGAGV